MELYYSKNLGERNFAALNNALKDVIQKREDDKLVIDKLQKDIAMLTVKLDTMNQTLNVYKAMSMGTGASV